jgi:hypothetical protein
MTDLAGVTPLQWKRAQEAERERQGKAMLVARLVELGVYIAFVGAAIASLVWL